MFLVLMILDEGEDLPLNLGLSLEKDCPCPAGSGSSLAEREKKAPSVALDLSLYENEPLAKEHKWLDILGMARNPVRGDCVSFEYLTVV